MTLPSRNVSPVQKEVQAIQKVCTQGKEVNIVQVLNHGLLTRHDYYYIDMELCDMNLDEFIHHHRSPGQSGSLPYFERKAGVASLQQIWEVMSHIA